MTSVLDKINKLLALSASANENEARSAALQAARLIREHNIVLQMPGAESAELPSADSLASRPKGAKVRDLHNVEWVFHEDWGGGGNCTFCGLPCFRGNAVYVSSGASAFLHVVCWMSRQTGKTRPGPAPPPSAPRPVRESPSKSNEMRASKAIDDFWDVFEKTRR